ncbi:MAG: AI-2E family transporter [Candidatus Competibacterales bacterium]|nr:AI-2E family transporter [Candidatus Competibacterales bacterium]
MNAADSEHRLARWLILGALLAGLLILAYQVLQPFLIPVIWALILAYVTWPAYRQLLRWLPNLAAPAMTLALGLLFALPLIWLIGLLQRELPAAHEYLSELLAQGSAALPPGIAGLPWLGPELTGLLDRLAEESQSLNQHLAEWVQPWIGQIVAVLGNVGRNLFKFGFALITVFFIYRHGEVLVSQSRRVLERFIGERARPYLSAVASTTRAVVYGLVLTALAQGLLAGLGYWAAGVRAPVLLGAVTAIVALVPFGPPLVWVPLGIGLLLEERWLAGLGLLAWGALVVSWVDNLIRPMVISSATRVPFLLVMFGVLGGIAAFGLVGLFLGPVIVAVLLAVWREWLEEQTGH